MLLLLCSLLSSEHHYFSIANHYLKCLHLLSESAALCKRAASFLLVAATSAKQVGSYLTALYFVKAAMFLMRLETQAPESENSKGNEDYQPEGSPEVEKEFLQQREHVTTIRQ